MNKVTIYTNKAVGQILPLHGVNCAPYDLTEGPEQATVKKYLTQASIPFSRLHDVCYPYGAGYFIDIPNIFKDFGADENDEKNYDFYYSDEYIKAIVSAGTELVYRLGVSIEWGSRKYTIVPPSDYEKWAKICQHIVMHYNEGWADGFHMNIKYWEIWNEPENPPMWTGTKEQFFELYRLSSKYLKTCFPALKFGGYGSCGFYAVTRRSCDAFYQSFLTYFTDFLEFCRTEACPLDFFSWHIYTDSPEEIAAHASFVRESLDSYGFMKTESHMNEWNYGAENRAFADKHTMVGASFLAGVLCKLQNLRCVDAAMYYVFSLNSIYNGFLDQNDYTVCPPYSVFVSFGELYRMGTQIETACEGDGIYAVAAAADGSVSAIVANYADKETRVRIQTDGAMTGAIFSLEQEDYLEKGEPISFDQVIDLQPYGVYFIKTTKGAYHAKS